MPSNLKPLDMIKPYKKSRRRWQVAKDAILELAILGLITDSEYQKIAARFYKWLNHHGYKLP